MSRWERVLAHSSKSFSHTLRSVSGAALVLGVINYFNGLNAAESELLQDLERELDNFIAAVSDQVDEQEDELTALARSITLHDYLQAQSLPSASPANDHVLKDLQITLAATLSKQSHLVNISLFDKQKQPIFFAERKPEAKAERRLWFSYPGPSAQSAATRTRRMGQRPRSLNRSVHPSRFPHRGPACESRFRSFV